MAYDDAKISDIKIQWHAAFCAAAELELSENRAELDFQREYNLSRKPLQIDLLIVEKLKSAAIKSEFGRIFRQYNVIEFKSPDDGLTIDDLVKTIGYACLYKSMGETVDQIPLGQLTVSLVREGRPRELFEALKRAGFAVSRAFDGIYYVEGLMYPVQIVVTRELKQGADGENLSLKVLSRNASEDDVLRFIEKAQRLTSQGEKENVDAILQVSVSANYELYDEIKRRDPVMCEAMKMLMKDEIQESRLEGRKEGRQEGRQEGRKEGRQEGALETLFGLVKDGILSVADAAMRAGMNAADFERAYKTFML